MLHRIGIAIIFSVLCKVNASEKPGDSIRLPYGSAEMLKMCTQLTCRLPKEFTELDFVEASLKDAFLAAKESTGFKPHQDMHVHVPNIQIQERLVKTLSGIFARKILTLQEALGLIFDPTAWLSSEESDKSFAASDAQHLPLPYLAPPYLQPGQARVFEIKGPASIFRGYTIKVETSIHNMNLCSGTANDMAYFTYSTAMFLEERAFNSLTGDQLNMLDATLGTLSETWAPIQLNVCGISEAAINNGKKEGLPAPIHDNDTACTTTQNTIAQNTIAHNAMAKPAVVNAAESVNELSEVVLNVADICVTHMLGLIQPVKQWFNSSASLLHIALELLVICMFKAVNSLLIRQQRGGLLPTYGKTYKVYKQ